MEDKANTAARRRPANRATEIPERASLPELAVRARAGDQRAFRELVAASTPALFRLATRVLGHSGNADDVLQESFVTAWQRLPHLRDEQAVLGWLGRIVRNRAIDQLRREKRQRRLNRDLRSDGAPAPSPGADEVLYLRELGSVAKAALESVPEKFRTVLLLRVSDGMANRDIAALLGCPVGTVESRLVRARHAMDKALRRGLNAEIRPKKPGEPR